MGRGRVPVENQKVKLNCASVMVERWVNDRIDAESRRTGEYIKDVVAGALTDFATKTLRRRAR